MQGASAILSSGVLYRFKMMNFFGNFKKGIDKCPKRC